MRVLLLLLLVGCTTLAPNTKVDREQPYAPMRVHSIVEVSSIAEATAECRKEFEVCGCVDAARLVVLQHDYGCLLHEVEHVVYGPKHKGE